MPDAALSAERLVRRFARETNLLVAGRTMSVDGDGDVARELRSLLGRLGAQVSSTPAEFSFSPGSEPQILLGGMPLPARVTPDERIDAAGASMPVSTSLARRLREDGTVRDVRIGIAMVLEPKTAQLALLLRAAGAQVAVYAHPDEIDLGVAEALRARGVPVDGSPDLSGAAERTAAVAFLRRGHDLLLDDGSHLIRLAHEEGLADTLRGAAEETTSGLAPLRRMDETGILRLPVVAVNDAPMKTAFDNRYGTGQACVFAVADLLERIGLTVRDHPAVVVGYGPVGEGVAAHLRALGARVAVSETDPVRALRAAHDGYRTGRLHDLAPGALVISATGAPHTIDADALRTAEVVAVAGGVPGEVDVDVERLVPIENDGAPVPDIELAGDGALVLARGACVNLAAAEGNPIEIMDLSFAVQLMAVEHLLLTSLSPGVHPLPVASDRAVARAALVARGEQVDEHSPAQRRA